MSGRFSTEVEIPQPVQPLFDYLLDPRNRPQWQSSLRSVRLDDPAAPVAVGLRWIDVTMIGVPARMSLDAVEPGRRMVETGEMAGITGRLTLEFEPRGEGSLVRVQGEMLGSGLRRPVAAVAARMAGLVAASDLRRAGRELAARR